MTGRADGPPAGAAALVEYSLACDDEAAEAVFQAFQRHSGGQAAVEVLDPQGGRQVRVLAYLPAADGDGQRRLEEAAWHLAQIRSLGRLRRRELSRQDWASSWQRRYSRPLRIPPRLLIRFPWQRQRQTPGEVVVEIEPGMAFGTGLHPSTRGCLAMLQEAVQAGARVLDVGTGSGILALAALRLGAGQVDACDLDPQAAAVAAANAARSGLSPRLQLWAGSVHALRPEPRYRLIVSNILLSVLVELAPALSRLLDPQGSWILGGILIEQAPPMEAALAGAGLEVVGRGQWQGWLTLRAARRRAM